MTTPNKNQQAGTGTVQQQEVTDFERLIKKEAKELSYVPFGAQDKIKLTVKIVQDLIAVKTKSGKTCSDNDALKFMMMCQAQRLNPFQGDAYLIGYDSQDGPKFSLITAHQSFLKRAEVHNDYDGMESGVILQDDEGSIIEREGDFHLPDEKIVGGWAKVYCKGRGRPTYRRLRRSRFDKGMSVWKDDPAGMIVKCAEADALRSTFPTMVGGLYLREELDFMPDVPLPVSRPLFESPLAKAMKQQAPAPELPESEAAQPDAPEEVAPEPAKPEPEVKATSASGHSYNPLKALRSLLATAHITEGKLLDHLTSVGATDGSSSSLDELAMVAPQVLQHVAENWQEYLPLLKGKK